MLLLGIVLADRPSAHYRCHLCQLRRGIARKKITPERRTEVSELGTDVLKRYAILTTLHRGMRAAVTAYCPHPSKQVE